MNIMSESFDIKHDTFGEASGAGDDNLVKRRDAAKKKDTRKDRKEKGYMMFDEEDSAEELMADDVNKSPTKVKKNVKTTFKFVKKEKVPKMKEKEKEDKKEKDGKDKLDKDKERKDKVEKVDKDKIKDRFDKIDKEKKVEKFDKDKDKKDRIEKDPKKEEDSKFKSKKKPASTVPQVTDDVKLLFGVALSYAVERSPCHDGIQLPIVVRECIDYIEEFGLTCEGIYRISGVKSKVQSLKDSYNKGVNVYLNEHEPSVVASLLKQFLRELPEPVLTVKLMPKFEQASTVKNVKQKVEQFEQLLNELPLENRVLLAWIIVHMTHVIALEKQNKMSLQNMSIVLSPTMQISHRVLNIFFGYAKILFKDTIIKKYVPPLKPVTSRWSLELPDSPSAIEEELKKQESLLNHLHEELMSVKDMNKEEQLWEVQRVVTQLKRKLKNAKQMQMSAEMAKHREDEISQDKTVQQQSLGRSAFRDKQAQLRIANQSLDESCEQSADELDQVVGLDTIDNDDNDSAIDQTDESQGKHLTTAGQDSDTQNAEDLDVIEVQALTENELQSVEPSVNIVVAETPLSDSCAIETAEQVQPAAECVEESITKCSQVDSNEDANPSLVQAAEVMCKTDENLDNGIDPSCNDEIPSDVAQLETKPDLDVLAATSEPDLHQELIQSAVVDVSKTDDEVQNVSIDFDECQADLQETIVDFHETVIAAEMAIDRQSPTDESSDAYTDVLDEEDIDRLSESLDKEDRPGPPVYVELQNDLSALTDSPSTNVKLLGDGAEEGKSDRILDTVAIDENEFDDTRPYSETTTSSEPSEFDDVEYEALELDSIRLMMEEEELLEIGDELRQKIRMEKREIERLHQDIIELRMIREDMSDSDQMSSSSSSDDSDDDDEDLQQILEQLICDNRNLEIDNADLCDKIHQERQICIAIKVESRMMQQQHMESSAYGLEDCESLL